MDSALKGEVARNLWEVFEITTVTITMERETKNCVLVCFCYVIMKFVTLPKEFQPMPSHAVRSHMKYITINAIRIQFPCFRVE